MMPPQPRVKWVILSSLTYKKCSSFRRAMAWSLPLNRSQPWMRLKQCRTQLLGTKVRLTPNPYPVILFPISIRNVRNLSCAQQRGGTEKPSTFRWINHISFTQIYYWLRNSIHMHTLTHKYNKKKTLRLSVFLWVLWWNKGAWVTGDNLLLSSSICSIGQSVGLCPRPMIADAVSR